MLELYTGKMGKDIHYKHHTSWFALYKFRLEERGMSKQREIWFGDRWFVVSW
jgi:hypothetical protein